MATTSQCFPCNSSLVLASMRESKISRPRIRCPGEPIAKKTKFGWMVMSPGQEVNLSNMFLTQTSVADYKDLCRFDMLGLEDSPTRDQRAVYSKFKEQLERSPKSW